MEMNTGRYLEEMKKMQKNLMDYLDNEVNFEESYQNLIIDFDNIKIHDNQFKIKSLFYLILKICNNRHRRSSLFSKIEQILQLFKIDMQKYFTNSELFHIFKSNKRLLLFLLEENLMIIDEFIVKKIINKNKYIDAKYPHYFQPEIQPFFNKKWFPKYNPKYYFISWMKEIKKELPENFYEKRKIGENDDEICELIQKDLIEDFIIYVNKNCYSVKSTINRSIYETNSFLLKNRNITLIEYAAFFGSTQIFNYLRKNGADLKPSLWLYAIHGNDAEIISILEEKNILSNSEYDDDDDDDDDESSDEENDAKISFDQIFKESIKCHHIDIINYIQSNYLQNEKKFLKDALINCFKYYNFMFMQCNIDETSFFYLCKYDYYLLVFNFFQEMFLDLNEKLI